MSLNDSSAIILIVGALAVIAFVIHGLWFSGKISNRKLSKTSSADQALQNANGLGKVRIVSSGSEEQNVAGTSKSFKYVDSQVTTEEPKKEHKAAETLKMDNVPSENEARGKPLDIYEINVESDTGHPFAGDHIKELFSEFGFVRTVQGLYVCPEAVGKDLSETPVVFRICSLTKPYSFPDDMQKYETPAIALYMKLPEIGKAESYYSCMYSAASEIARRLGGKFTTAEGEPLTDQILNDTLDLLHDYDEPANIRHQVY